MLTIQLNRNFSSNNFCLIIKSIRLHSLRFMCWNIFGFIHLRASRLFLAVQFYVLLDSKLISSSVFQCKTTSGYIIDNLMTGHELLSILSFAILLIHLNAAFGAENYEDWNYHGRCSQTAIELFIFGINSFLMSYTLITCIRLFLCATQQTSMHGRRSSTAAKDRNSHPSI